jgi:hypothetical protein
MRRHLREEAYRVITRVTAAGLRGEAGRVFLRYYLPNLDSSTSALKETVKVLAKLLGPGARPPSR